MNKESGAKLATEAQYRVLNVMRATRQPLCVEFMDGTVIYFLPNGQWIHPKVAQNIIAKGYLRSNEDTLFEGAQPQSYSLNTESTAPGRAA